MKKLILGITWQVLGFAGSLGIILAASDNPWNYDGITGILGSLLGLELLVPLFFCIALFAAGIIVSLISIKEK